MALGGMSSATIRIILSGQRAAIAGIEATKTAVTGLKDRVEEYGVAAETASKRGALMTQGIYMMRRMAYFGTLALIGAGVEALKWGISFNQTMQSATIALKPVMSNIGQVRGELLKLFQISKYSPFRFQDMTVAFRSMYLAMQPLGISAQTVNTTLQSMVDALAATGRTSPTQLNRVSVALQHMAYQGRLTGFTVNQLARDGIPIFAALRKELGLTGDQLHNISKLGIPAQTVLDAINKYIETTPAYMNAAKRQAQSLQGELTTLKDNISQTMGALTFGGFAGLTGRKGVLQNINNMFDDISKTIIKQKGKISIGQVFGTMGKDWPWIKPFLTNIQNIIKVVKDLWLILKNGILPILFIVASAANILFNALRPLIWAIKEVSKHSWLLVPILSTLAGLWVTDRILVTLDSTAKKWNAFWTTMQTRTLSEMTGAQRIYIYYTKLATYWTRIWGIFMGRIWVKQGAGAFASLTGMEKMVRKLGLAIRTSLIPAIRAAGAAMLTAFIEGGPIVWIIAAVILLTVGLVVLYFKWKWFHNLVNTTFKWIWEHWKLMVIIFGIFMPMFAIMLLTARLVYDHWNEIKKLLTWIWNNVLKPLFTWLERNWKWLSDLIVPWQQLIQILQMVVGWFKSIAGWLDKMIDKVKHWLSLWKKIPFATTIVGAAKGAYGAVASAGSWFWNQPGIGKPDVSGGGAITSPAMQMSPFQNIGKNPLSKIEIHNHVHLDGKEIAANSAKHRQKARARATGGA